MRDGRRRGAPRRRSMTAASRPTPPNKAGKEITVVDVPKLIGIGYFNATSKGIQDAAKELGNVKAKTDGPTEAKIDEQIKFIDNYITSGVDGILFAANDPVAIAPVLKKALSKGIHVVGYDANSTPDAREWFVNQAPVQRHRQGDDRLDGQGEPARTRPSPSSPRPSPRRTRRAGSPRCRPTPPSAIRR